MSPTSNNVLSGDNSTTNSFVGGCVAGVVGCLVGHPFDTMKLIQQTSNQGRLSVREGYKKLTRTMGGHRALWRGLGPALTVQVITSGFLFGTQNLVTSSVGGIEWLFSGIKEEAIDSEYRLQQAMSVSTVTCATVSGFLTGGLLSPVVCPLEGLKCRAQVVAAVSSSSATGKLRSLYSGFLPSVLRCSFGNAAFFGVYALFHDTGPLAGINPAVGGACAGAAFWVAGMPFDVLKSRMQTADPKAALPTLRGTFKAVWKQAGVRGLYAGLPVTLARAIPMNAAVLFTYELVIAMRGPSHSN
jgi:hypothetical protein